MDLDAPVEAGLAHRLGGDEGVRRRAVVELHEERRPERIATVVGDEMAVADDAIAEGRDVALLLRQQCTARVGRTRLGPATDRPLRRLAAVVILERLALQSVTRIARQIPGWLVLHVISPMVGVRSVGWVSLRSTHPTRLR